MVKVVRKNISRAQTQGRTRKTNSDPAAPDHAVYTPDGKLTFQTKRIRGVGRAGIRYRQNRSPSRNYLGMRVCAPMIPGQGGGAEAEEQAAKRGHLPAVVPATGEHPEGGPADLAVGAILAPGRPM